METIDNVKKRIIVSMISILLLIITIFGITYAYFLANVKGNENDKSVSVTAGKLELIYDDEDSIIIAEKIKPGIALDEKVFSVANTGTAKVDNYDVVLEKVINELKYYEDLTYVLTCKSYKSSDYETNGTESLEYGTCNGSKGIFPKYDNALVTNSIDKDVTHYYTLKVTYHETYTDQSDDMNKQVSAKVNIRDNYRNYTVFNVYGNTNITKVNSEQDISPINSAVFKSLGTLVNDETDENYGMHKIDITVRGKNLINVNKATTSNTMKYNNYGITQTRTSSTNGGYKFSISTIKANTPIYVSFDYVDSSEGQTRIYMRPFDTDGNRLSGQNVSFSSEKGTLKWNKDINKIEFYTMSANPVGTFYTIDNLMITTVQNAKFEPYIEPVTYSLYLKEPLRCINEVCDYIDFVNKKVIRKIGVKTFFGNENWNISNNYNFYSDVIEDAKPSSNVLFTHSVSSAVGLYDDGTNNIFISEDKRINWEISNISHTIQELKEYINGEVNNSRIPTLYYYLNSDKINDLQFIDVSGFVDRIISVDANELESSKIEIETDK